MHQCFQQLLSHLNGVQLRFIVLTAQEVDEGGLPQLSRPHARDIFPAQLPLLQQARLQDMLQHLNSEPASLTRSMGLA